MKSLYKEEYCEKIIEFFSREQYTTEYKEYYRNGKLQRKEPVLIPNSLPFIADFAAEIGTQTQTLLRWTKDFPEFNRAYTRAKELQKSWLINNSLKKLYDSHFAQFTAKNITDMRDTSVIEENKNVKIEMYLPESPLKKELPNKKKSKKEVQNAVIIREIKPEENSKKVSNQ